MNDIYKIISAKKISDLQSAVNEAILLYGYEPLGGIQFFENEFHQAMQKNMLLAHMAENFKGYLDTLVQTAAQVPPPAKI